MPARAQALLARARARLGRRPSPGLLEIAALALIYFVAAKAGLRLAFVHASATAVWAPSGIAVAALLRLGLGVWPGVFTGALLANLTTAGTLGTSLGIATGNTLEGVLAALLVRRFAGTMLRSGRAQDILLFAVLAAGLSTTVSATVGVASLALGGFAAPGNLRAIWLTWWLGDAVGCLVFGPMILLWTTRFRLSARPRRGLEVAALLVAVVLSGELAFGGTIGPSSGPLEFLCFPVLAWAAFRFGQREAATAVLLLDFIAIWGTLSGFGAFARGSPHESLLLVQAFIGVSTLTVLVLASVVAEHRHLEERLRQQAETDPLTGLANYRQLVKVLDHEIRRTQRTGRTFAVVLFDLDGLKQLNDRHGHPEGSRALQRVAYALRASCRELDTAARYGGDEFAVVLPESGLPAGLHFSSRIAALLAADPEEPKVSVSAGVAEFPSDGVDAEALIRAADTELYAAKARRS